RGRFGPRLDDSIHRGLSVRPALRPGVSPGRPHQSYALWEDSTHARRPDAAFPFYMALLGGFAPVQSLPPARKPSCSRQRAAPYIFLHGTRAIALPRRQPLSKPMLNEVYNSRILELAGNIPRLGRLDNPDATATAHSKLCGSTLPIHLQTEGDTLTRFSPQPKACAAAHGAATSMARSGAGETAAAWRAARERAARMLKQAAAPPSGKWADVAVLEPVRDYKARHASTMLTFDAVTAAIDQIEAKRRAAIAAE